MAEPEVYKTKICLVGNGGVGKTSLIRRFVLDEYEDKYITTVGTKVTKNEILQQHPATGQDVKLVMTIWDIMGQRGFRTLLKESYFYGASGVIAVCDCTNPSTMKGLRDWIKLYRGVIGNAPTVILCNKLDLVEEQMINREDLDEFASKYGDPPSYFTSAKTGANVNLAFTKLAELILKDIGDGEEVKVPSE